MEETSVRVIIESPFAGGFANVKYARRAMRDSISRGESPYASHLLYTQKGLLDDTKPDERALGIAAANGWLEVADFVAVYCDMGITGGMLEGIIKAAKLNKEIRRRWIDENRAEEVLHYASD